MPRKPSHNTRALKRHDGFHISRRPIVRRETQDHAHYVADPVELPHAYGPPILFAIARDPHTIFASWSIDWQSTFEKATPVNRRVHLRVCRADGMEEMRVAVEPMASSHYVTMSNLHGPYRLEIGYYQPADVWHSIANSSDVLMPPDRIADQADVDHLAAVPLHLKFQSLLDVLGAKTDAPCAIEMSKFQKQILSKRHEALTADEQKILENLGVSLSEIEIARHKFSQDDCEKLARRTRALVGAGSTSPSRGFEAAVASAVS